MTGAKVLALIGLILMLFGMGLYFLADMPAEACVPIILFGGVIMFIAFDLDAYIRQLEEELDIEPEWTEDDIP